jgi:hypothetical protein
MINQMTIHKSIKFQISNNFNNFSRSINANTQNKLLKYLKREEWNVFYIFNDHEKYNIK